MGNECVMCGRSGERAVGGVLWSVDGFLYCGSCLSVSAAEWKRQAFSLRGDGGAMPTPNVTMSLDDFMKTVVDGSSSGRSRADEDHIRQLHEEVDRLRNHLLAAARTLYEKGIHVGTDKIAKGIEKLATQMYAARNGEVKALRRHVDAAEDSLSEIRAFLRCQGILVLPGEDILAGMQRLAERCQDGDARRTFAELESARAGDKYKDEEIQRLRRLVKRLTATMADAIQDAKNNS